MSKTLLLRCGKAIIASGAITLMLFSTQTKASGFNASNLVSNVDFVDIGGMSTGGIQDFLNSRNSCLKNFSEGGRSAASIIYDAAHGHGDASGSFGGITINTSTGTVNPEVLLVTLQKEQSLITDPGRCTESVLRKAMGYGCPDSGGCSSKYAGFTKQMEWGAWQLRYNYERSSGHGYSNYQVGQSFCFDDWNGQHCGRFDNRATAALYRYTPHVYNGNYNFWNLFHNTYQFQRPAYSHRYTSQNGDPTLRTGQSYKFTLRVKNTGTSTWRRGRVNLATSKGHDRISGFLREGDGPSGWISPNRIKFTQSTVAPNAYATYEFYMEVPRGMPPGQYREYFQLVADGVGWMEDYGIYWNITVPSQYSYQYISQNSNPTLRKGRSYKFTLRVKNTGQSTWRRNKVRLGTSRDHDRISSFLREGGNPSGWISGNRIQLKESSVAPNAYGTFEFYMKVPNNMSAGSYREYFQVVADGVGWLQDYGIYWQIRVR